MAILTREKILEKIEQGEVSIKPFREENIGPASVDLTLWNKFRIFNASEKIFDIDNFSDYKTISTLIKKDNVVVYPQETILGITEEKVMLPPGLCGWLEGRSRFARIGLMVHISASFMQPGISNHQVLEISNMGHVPIRLHAGTRICQFIFEETLGEAVYKGEFGQQDEP